PSAEIRALGRLGAAAALAAPTSPTGIARATPVGLLDDRGRPAQARRHLVGHDLDDAALLAFLLVAALLEPAGDDDPCPLLERLGHVLGQLPPADDVEEARRLPPSSAAFVLPARVDAAP